MADVSTYNPDAVTVVVGGIPISGFADGTFVEIEPMSDGVTSVSGADGEIARAISTDRRHTVTLTLLQTSDSNDLLAGLYGVDLESTAGAMVPVIVSDLSGRSLFAASKAWITKLPKTTFSKGIESKAWVLHTGRPSVYLPGGNG